ncbi:hypothetical protein JOF56_005306 [Kibdelosporangium banguiense]|uniref:Uncharacterized protein n=1 Tax=Kibdelosporangium banguiense TaxID=1365924 RepID=A0ABS4TKL0_9PSEU|nr:hypothetical protein [Kibdelosporangium banguiense]MBP2324921.1 hypothetical protein [Kibdelosporangium banguiense]
MRVVRHGSGARRWRARFGVLTAITSVFSTLLVVLVPGVASAGAIVPCPDTITEWRVVRSLGRAGYRWEGYRYTTYSVTPIFMVSDGRLLDNQLDSPATYTVSSSIQQTFRISASVGVDAKVGEYLTTKVSSSIEASRTTQIGVQVSTVVPARSRVIAEYGVEGYYVTYAIEAWQYSGWSPGPGQRCEEWGYYPQATNAPTRVEGWRLRAG